MKVKKPVKKTPKKVIAKKSPTRASDDRHYPSRPVVGIGVVVWREDKVLLIKRGHAPRAGEWGLPGGMQMLGETIMEAAVREVREETGLDIAPFGVITALDAVIKDTKGKIEYHYTIIDVVAESREGVAKAQDDATEVRWASLPEVDQLCKWKEVSRVVRLSLLQRVL
jgi:ADP-ribose pyrophosphatase YjhB (NUDIX family)